ADGALIVSVTCQVITLEEVYTLAMSESNERQDSKNTADRESTARQPLTQGR
ncbi:MAG: hypothetical protein H0U76_24170, partial [Ktedonobacteraceae bacterium]|nr:hypothetical protein [Ktedonobacteraceae bacterium]